MEERSLRSPTADDVAHLFQEHFGRPPDGVWQAPGRVNLIGEHTDYNAGWALPFAIDRRVLVAAARRHDGRLRCISAQSDHEVQAETGSLSPKSVAGWGAYPLGGVWALCQAGYDTGGFDVAVDSGVPLGRGLSSSAALTAAVAVAVAELTGVEPDLAALCQRAEAEFVGTPVGMLDPLAVLGGRGGMALMIDFAALSVTPVPLKVGPLVVVDTGVVRSVGSGAYADRRRQCQEAAQRLGVVDLRHVDLATVETGLDGVLRRRARHVVSENQRVLEVVERLRIGIGIGDVLLASHASLRHDFEVSCPELDAVVEVAVEAGADGARLTGAGFGGCVISVGVSAEAIEEGLRRRFGNASGDGSRPPEFGDATAGGARPTIFGDASGAGPRPTAFPVAPSQGAGRLR
ncbi:MAG TPA: galactokinase [Acidimicrobiales bacterium]|jgi:galactokinase|nr:galactokinase [Acidimicrobiales bacterium]